MRSLVLPVPSPRLPVVRQAVKGKERCTLASVVSAVQSKLADRFDATKTVSGNWPPSFLLPLPFAGHLLRVVCLRIPTCHGLCGALLCFARLCCAPFSALLRRYKCAGCAFGLMWCAFGVVWLLGRVSQDVEDRLENLVATGLLAKGLASGSSSAHDSDFSVWLAHDALDDGVEESKSFAGIPPSPSSCLCLSPRSASAVPVARHTCACQRTVAWACPRLDQGAAPRLVCCALG